MSNLSDNDKKILKFLYPNKSFNIAHIVVGLNIKYAVIQWALKKLAQKNLIFLTYEILDEGRTKVGGPRKYARLTREGVQLVDTFTADDVRLLSTNEEDNTTKEQQ